MGGPIQSLRHQPDPTDVGGLGLSEPRIVATADAVESVKPPWRQIMRATGISSSLLLTRAG
jgi:hypothetical protein